MSYDIDAFKVKKLNNLSFPVSSLFKHEREDWHFERKNNDDGTVVFEGMSTILNGKIKDDIFFVESIECYGEGSGTEMNWILEPALEDSTGELIASCVWEGGDSINKLIVKDGEIDWEEIEI